MFIVTLSSFEIMWGSGYIQRVQTAWPSLDLALETPWLALSGPLLSSYTQTG